MNILEFSVRKCQDFARCKAVNPTVLMLIYRFSGKVFNFQPGYNSGPKFL